MNQPEPVANNYPHSWDLVFKGANSDHELRDIYADAWRLLQRVVKYQNPEANTQKIIASMAHERDMLGASRYGTHLQPFNGRDSIQDAVEEVLDLVVYLRTALYEETGQ